MGEELAGGARFNFLREAGAGGVKSRVREKAKRPNCSVIPTRANDSRPLPARAWV